MQAVIYSHTGSADVLELVDREVPSVAPGEVRVRIIVSGVNPTDWKSRSGNGDRLEIEQVPNQDGSGIVDAVGADVSSFAVGDRVWVWDAAFKRPSGTAQELVVLPASQVVRLDDAVSFDVGASLGIPALTAHHTLTANGPERLSPGALTGQVVLVAGGAGAVGHAAIQLALWAGATVITTVSSDEKAALARAAGAHHVINYRTADTAAAILAIAPNGVNTVVEVNPVANLALDLRVITRGGLIAIYATDTDEPLVMPIGDAMVKNAVVQFVLTYTVSPEQKQHAVAAISAAAAAGILAVGTDAGLPLERFTLAEAADAHRAVETNTVGKVLIDVAAAS
ncbi:MAG: NADPH:quinone reductase [Microbacteriaceae bacterium]|nr:NADPH:quinone reductase [Microbacteriaceae bacterium]